MFFVLAAPLEGTLDAGRALATLATERSQGFIDAEPYNTRTWNGVWVIPHLHVDGRGGPQDLRGAWSEPLNAKTNTLCTPNATSPALRCPDRCAATHRVARRRVRRAIHALSDREWPRCSAAGWRSPHHRRCRRLRTSTDADADAAPRQPPPPRLHDHRGVGG